VCSSDLNYRMGEHIRPGCGPIRFDLALSDVPAGSRLVFMKNGHTLAEERPQDAAPRYHFTDSPDWEARNWYRVDLFNAAGEVWAVTNPIYAGSPPSQPAETWGQALARAKSENMIIEQTIFE
jgi:hypothetical protein